MIYVRYTLCALALQLLISGTVHSADSQTAVHMLFSQNGNSQQQWHLVIGDNRVATLDANDQVLSIFDASSSKLYTLDHANSSYRISDVASVQTLAANIQAGMAALEAKIASLPPTQQDNAREQLLGFFPQRQQTTSSSEFVPNGETGNFAGVRCEWLDTLMNREKIGRICATAPDKLPGGPTLHNMLESFSYMYEAMEEADLGSIALPLPENPMAPVASLGLIPIKMEEYGATQSSSPGVELVSVKEQLTAPSLLQLPHDYKLQSSPASGPSRDANHTR